MRKTIKEIIATIWIGFVLFVFLIVMLAFWLCATATIWQIRNGPDNAWYEFGGFGY